MAARAVATTDSSRIIPPRRRWAASCSPPSRASSCWPSSLEVLGVGGGEGQRGAGTCGDDRAEEEGGLLVPADRGEDAGQLPQAQPLVGPVAALEPGLDHLAVAVEGFGWSRRCRPRSHIASVMANAPSNGCRRRLPAWRESSSTVTARPRLDAGVAGRDSAEAGGVGGLGGGGRAARRGGLPPRDSAASRSAPSRSPRLVRETERM